MVHNMCKYAKHTQLGYLKYMYHKAKNRATEKKQWE